MRIFLKSTKLKKHGVHSDRIGIYNDVVNFEKEVHKNEH